MLKTDELHRAELVIPVRVDRGFMKAEPEGVNNGPGDKHTENDQERGDEEIACHVFSEVRGSV